MILILIVSEIIPLIYVILGYIFWHHPPKNINGSAGWRTKQSMKSQETWDYANTYGGKGLYVMGLIQLGVTLVLDFFTLRLKGDILGLFLIVLVIVQASLMVVIYKQIENELKVKF